MSLADWLSPTLRQPSGFSFRVTDVTETEHVPSPGALADLLADAFWDIDYLKSLSEKYGFTSLHQNLLADRSQSIQSVRRGDFGEVIAAEFLREIEGYTIPVAKLRFKFASNQTLPGADCVAITLSGKALSKVAFVESKFRTSLDLAVAVTGCKQLKDSVEKDGSEILTFIARQLRSNGDDLATAFEDYIFQRNEDLTCYLLMILHDSSSWDERILRNLHDEEIDLEPLHVYVTRVSDLANLADSAFCHLTTGPVSNGS